MNCSASGRHVFFFFFFFFCLWIGFWLSRHHLNGRHVSLYMQLRAVPVVRWLYTGAGLNCPASGVNEYMDIFDGSVVYVWPFTAMKRAMKWIWQFSRLYIPAHVLSPPSYPVYAKYLNIDHHSSKLLMGQLGCVQEVIQSQGTYVALVFRPDELMVGLKSTCMTQSHNTA